MTMSPSYLAIGMGGHFEGFVGCGESQASRETAMFVSLPAHGAEMYRFEHKDNNRVRSSLINSSAALDAFQN